MDNNDTKSTLASRLSSSMKSAGMTQQELAQAVGVSQNAIQKLVNGKSKSSRKIIEIAKVLKVELDWLLTGEHEHPESNAEILGSFDTWDRNTPLGDDEVEVPFYMDVELSAGSGFLCDTAERTGLKLRFARSTLRRYNVQPELAACVKVTGNSMEPVLPSGASVGINKADVNIDDGKMYAINHSGELRIKILYKLPGGGLRIRSFNVDEHPEEIYTAEESKEIVVLGKIFWYSVLM